jgi:hypothetical protein
MAHVESREEKAMRIAQAKLDIAQDDELLGPPDNSHFFPRGQWNAMPHRKLMERIAYTNHGTWQGKLDWIKGSVPLGAALEAVAVGFCDGIVLKCLVPPEQIRNPDGSPLTKDDDQRKARYSMFGTRCQKVREIIRDAGLKLDQNDVTGARLFKASAGNERKRNPARVPEPYEITADTVPGRGADPKPVPKGEWWWQHILIHFTHKDNDLQKVINLVRSGEFARHGLWLNDFDVTIDCKGVVDCQRLIKWLAEKTDGTFIIQGQQLSVSEFDSEGEPQTKHAQVILNNAHKVGLNCVAWMQTDPQTGLQIRLKVYLKLVQQFEKKEVRDTCGHHIHDVIEAIDTRLSHATDATKDHGLLRSESTIYVDKSSIPISKAHLSIPKTAAEVTQFCQRQLEIVPAHLVRKAPHSLMIQNWANNLKHTLVVVDLYRDECLVAYSKNEVTETMAGTFVPSYTRRFKHVLQKLMLGDHPVDVIFLHRGSDETSIPQELPEPKSGFERSGAAKLLEKRRKSKKLHDFVDRDMDWEVGLAGSKRNVEGVVVAEPAPADESDSDMDSGDEQSEAEEEEEPELDEQAKIAIALKQQRERLEAERAAIDLAADTVSTVDAGDAPPRYRVPLGALVVTTARYHRIPTDPDQPNPTEFPKGGLEHFFKLPNDPPGIKPINPKATTPKELKANKEVKSENERLRLAASTAFMMERLHTIGFRPITGLASLCVLPRLEPKPITQKINDAYLMETESMLVLDLNSIAGAQKLQSFMLNKKQIEARQKRKEQLQASRQQERLANINTGTAERAMLIESGKRKAASMEAKGHLRESYNRAEAKSLRTALDPGVYEIVAIRVREQKEGASDKFDILLRVGDKIVPYKGLQNIIDAIATKQDDLLPLRNGIGGESFYMHHDCNLQPIGTFEMAASTSKGANGKPVVDCGITIGDLLVLETQAKLREKHAAEGTTTTSDAAEMEVDSDSPSLPPPPPLLVTDTLKRGLGAKDYIGNKFDVDRKQKHYAPRVLKVLKSGVTKHYQHEAVVLEVQEDVAGSEPIILWGGETLNKRVDELSAGCRLVIHKVKAKNALDVKIVSEADWHWSCRLPTSYTAIGNAIQKGEHSGQPAKIQIRDCYLMASDGGSNATTAQVKHPVLLDSEDKIWRFLAPQTVKAVPAKNQPGLALVPGAVLDTVQFTVNPPTAE